MPVKTTICCTFMIAATLLLGARCRNDSVDIRNNMAPVNETPIKLLALGDSYTIGEAVEEHQRWPVQLVNKLRTVGFGAADPVIIATTGWRTDQLKQAITAAAIAPGRHNFVSLLIGVNNQYQGKSAESYKPEFEELLQTAITIAGDAKRVLVISIPDYGYTPFGKANQAAISQAIDSFNAVNLAISSKYQVTYVNITDISRLGLEQPDLVATDGLHPSGKMYTLWTNRILDQFDFDQYK